MRQEGEKSDGDDDGIPDGILDSESEQAQRATKPKAE